MEKGLKFEECRTEYEVPTEIRLSKLITKLQVVLDEYGDVMLNQIGIDGISWWIDRVLKYGTCVPFKKGELNG